MTQDKLDHLDDSYSFFTGVIVRLPKDDETITSTHPSEVAFYEVVFQVGMRFPIHRTLRRILAFFNFCLA